MVVRYPAAGLRRRSRLPAAGSRRRLDPPWRDPGASRSPTTDPGVRIPRGNPALPGRLSPELSSTRRDSGDLFAPRAPCRRGAPRRSEGAQNAPLRRGPRRTSSGSTSAKSAPASRAAPSASARAKSARGAMAGSRARSARRGCAEGARIGRAGSLSRISSAAPENFLGRGGRARLGTRAGRSGGSISALTLALARAG